MTHQQARFLNLMEGYTESIKLYEGALNSAGTTQEKFALWQEGTEAQFNELANASMEMWMKFFNSAIINGGIKALTDLINTFNTLIDSIGGTNTAIMLLGSAFLLLRGKSLIDLVDRIISFGNEANIASNKIKGMSSTMLFCNGIIPALKAGLVGLQTTLTTLAINPMTWIFAVATLIPTFLMLTANYERKLKEETDALATSYNDLTTAMKENNKNGIVNSKDPLIEEQNKLQELLEKRIKLQGKFKALNESGKNNELQGIATELNSVNKEIDHITTKLDGAGIAYSKTTGEVYALAEANLLLKNQDIAESIRNGTESYVDYKLQIEQLKDEYDKLIKIENKTVEQKARLSTISKSLREVIKDLTLVKDKEGNVTIKNTELLGKEIKVIKDEGTAHEQLINLKLWASKQNAEIQIGMTTMTYNQAQERIKILRSEMDNIEKYYSYMNGIVNKKSSKLNAREAYDLMTNGFAYKTGLKTPENDTILQSIKSELELYEKATSTLDDVYKPNTTDTTPKISGARNPDKNKEKKESLDALTQSQEKYNNSLKALDIIQDSLQKKLEKMSETDGNRSSNLQEQLKIVEKKIKLDEQNLKNEEKANSLKKQNKIDKNDNQTAQNLLKHKEERDGLKGQILQFPITVLEESIRQSESKISRIQSIMKLYDEDSNDYVNLLKSEIIELDKKQNKYNKLQNLINEQLKNEKLTTKDIKERKDKLEEITRLKFDNLAEIKKLRESLLSDEADKAIDRIKKVYEKQKELELKAINERQKALEKASKEEIEKIERARDAYNDFIDSQIKALDRLNDKQNYDEDMEKTLKERQEIQNKINTLSLATDTDSQNQVIELKKQLAEKDLEIEKKKRENTNKLQKNQLEDMKKTNDKQVEDKIKTEDRKLESIKEAIEEEKQAIEDKFVDLLENEERYARLRKDIIGGNIQEINKMISEQLEWIKKNVKEIGTNYANMLTGNLIDSSKGLGEAKDVGETKAPPEVTKYKTPSVGLKTMNEILNEQKYLHTKMVEAKKANNVALIQWIKQERKKWGLDPETGAIVNAIEVKHEGGIISGKSSGKLAEITNKLFNTKPNEAIVKMLKGELAIPEKNIRDNFIPNLQNLISGMLPNFELATSGGGSVNNYNINFNIDKLNGNKNDAENLANIVVNGIKRIGGRI